MPTPNTHFTLHDSPIGLVLQIILISLVFGVLYLGISIAGEMFPAFDDTLILGDFLTADFIVFISLVLLQQGITLYLLLRWLRLTYTFDDKELIVRRGAFFRKTMTVPFEKIISVEQHQTPLGHLFDYSTITLSLLGASNRIVIPYMTQPKQVLKLLGLAEGVCT